MNTNTEVKGNVGKLVNIDTVNGTVNIESNNQALKKESILFLRINKKEGNDYQLRLELKTEEKIETIIEERTINIEDSFYEELRNFEEARKGRADLREIEGIRQIGAEPYWEDSIGKKIYDTFFVGEIRQVFEEFFNLLTDRKLDRMTLVISSPVPEILNIPFELIKAKQFYTLANDAFKIIHSSESRVEDFEIKTESIAPPLKILFVASLPKSLSENEKFLELEKEEEKLIEVLGGLISEEKVFVEFAEIASLEEISSLLSKGRHNIIHISGHGVHAGDEEDGILYFEDNEGHEQLVTGEEFAEVVRQYQSVKMVVLSACETARAEDFGVAGAVIQAGIPAVLAMRYSVSDNAARKFTTRFYEEVCAGRNLSTALFAGRKTVEEYDRKRKEEDSYYPSEWATPFLYLNQNMNYMIDYDKTPENTEYFTQKQENILIGGKRRAKGFVGRHKELVKLTNLFREGKKAVCIYGMGGLGKTTLALRFANDFENKSYKIVQFRGAVTEEEILKEIAKLASKDLGNKIVKLVNNPDYSPREKLQALIDNYLIDNKIIFIFDNFEDNQKDGDEIQLEIAQESLAEFLDYFCKQLQLPKNNYVLFTTRYRFSKPEVEMMNMAEMNFPDSFKIMNRLDILRSLSTEEKRDIHQKLGGHPRAFELLDSYFENENVNWEDIKDKFEQVQDELDKKGTKTNKAILFDILVDKLSAEELEILKYAAIFRIPRKLKCLTGDYKQVKKILSKISKLSLLYFDAAEEIFVVHRLTSNYVLDEKTEKEERIELHKRAADYYLNLPEEERKDPLEEYLEARWHYIQAEEYEEAVEITLGLDNALSEKGFADLILELYNELLVFSLSKNNHSKVFHQLGMIYQYKGEYDKALDFYQQSKEMREEIEDIKGLGNYYGQIGLLYKERKDYKNALRSTLKAFMIFAELEVPEVQIAENTLNQLKEEMGEEKFEKNFKELTEE